MEETLSFEEAFERLEKILETMNGGKTPLEETLKLFEKADQLMRVCTSRLNAAEQKIEQIVKGRGGEISLEPFSKELGANLPCGAKPSEEAPFR